jgi:hypothetical protein
MNKSKAISLSRSDSNFSITHANSIFSNINSAKDVWWLEPNNKKFQIDLFLILNNHRDNRLFLFKLPSNTIVNPADRFIQRNDAVKTNCSKIYIEVSETKFEQKNVFDFTPYLIKQIRY